MELLLMRHPEVAAEARLRCYGHTDVALSDSGKASVKTLAETAARFRPSRLLSSDLSRCRFVAEQVSFLLDLPAEFSPAWREMHFGAWENRSWQDLNESEADTLKRWSDNFVTVAPPEGESFAQLALRIGTQLEKLLAEDVRRAADGDAGRIAVVTHAGVIRAALCQTLGLPLERAFSIEMPYGATAALSCRDERWTLRSLTPPTP